MNDKDIKYFEVAKSMSLLSDFKRVHIGAVVVLKNEIIATGRNTIKTHPLQSHYANLVNRPHAILLHAEMSCLIKLVDTKHDLSNAKIYIFRQSKSGLLSIAKPCSICSRALRDFGIKQIYYTTNRGYCNELLTA